MTLRIYDEGKDASDMYLFITFVCGIIM